MRSGKRQRAGYTIAVDNFKSIVRVMSCIYNVWEQVFYTSLGTIINGPGDDSSAKKMSRSERCSFER